MNNDLKAVLGLDAAQAGVAWQLLDPDQHPLAHGRASANQSGLDRLAAALGAHNLAWPEVLVAVESTGQWHLPWCEKLHALGARVYVLNPLLAKRTTALANAIRDHKTDPLDATALAELLAREHRRLERFRYQPRPALCKLHRLQSARASLRANLTNLKKSLGAMQALVFPELAALKFCDRRERALMLRAPTPARLLALEGGELEKLAGAKAEALRQAAAQSFASAALSEAGAGALQQLARAVEALEAQLAALDRDIEQTALEAIEPEVLTRAQTLPGFGRKTAVGILAHLPAALLHCGAPRRKLANKIQAQLGCEPRLRQSGKSTGKVKLSKRGCRPARTALYQAAMCAVINDESLRGVYLALKARGKHHKVAIFDIARRLIRRLVALITPPFINLHLSPCSP
jgi:transposase